MKIKRITITVFCAVFLCALIPGTLSAAEQGGSATRRLGLFIGSNNGGRDRVMLRYAVSDARSVSKIFNDMGGITPADNNLLVEPTVAEINRRLDSLGETLETAGRNFQRTEFVFYYSGHSDEEGLLLNRERYSYRALREKINSINTDMRIVILDSCSSGAITRAKGGVKTRPFLFDNSVSVEGYAFLTSSSADEASQESDSIESSFFTHSLVAGLRGAADTIGDGRVTLNELYRFAYNETLAKTETSVYGAQHPSYDMQVSGSGDVVLTDIKETSASLVIDGELTGRITIRDSSDFLVAELTKANQKPMELGLEPGLYRITLQKGDNFYRSEILLSENNRTPLAMGDFSQIASASGNRNRGDDYPADEKAASYEVPEYFINIQLLPGLDLPSHHGEKATDNLLFGLLLGIGHNIKGIGVAPLGVVNTGYVSGLQSSFLFNMAEDYVDGVQAAGLFNYAGGNITGLQTSGLFNVAKAEVKGAQVSGLFNYAGSLKGFQSALVNVSDGGKGFQLGLFNIAESEDIVAIGLVNIMKNGILHPSIYVDDMMFLNAGFRSGSKHFYTHFGAGVNRGFLHGSGEDKLTIGRAGFGFEIPINKFFIDIEASAGTIINVDKISDYKEANGDWHKAWKDDRPPGSFFQLYQLRLVAGYKIFKHLGIFGGVSYDYLYDHNGEEGSGPKDFSRVFIGQTEGKHTHKFGFFGGIQF